VAPEQNGDADYSIVTAFEANLKRGFLNLIQKMLNLIQIIIQKAL
jgi:hypothetical protein